MSITSRQDDYLRFMRDMKKHSAKEIATAMSISRANKTAKDLVNRGFFEHEKVRGVSYFRLKRRYEEIRAEHDISDKTPWGSRAQIPEAEKLYLAMLINGGMTGRERNEQFQKLYPHRTNGSLRNMPMLCRREGLIR